MPSRFTADFPDKSRLANLLIEQGIPIQPVTQLDQIRVVNQTQVLALKSIYGLSDLRDKVTTTGTGSVTNTVGSGAYRLRVLAANDMARLETAERGRYEPGLEVLVGNGLRTQTAPTGTTELICGLFDAQNGLYFGQNETGVFVGRRRAGVEASRTYQSAWSRMKLNGDNGVTLDLTDGNIVQLGFTWYGFGVIEYKLVITDENNRQLTVVVHRERVRGDTSLEDPNLPIATELSAGASAPPGGDYSVYISGRQYAVLGNYDPAFRLTAQEVLAKGSVGNTPLPLASVRRKAAYKSVAAQLYEISLQSTQDMFVDVRFNATLTGASYGAFGNIPATETGLEADTAATAVSGGQALYKGLVSAGAGPRTVASVLNLAPLDLPQDGVFTLTARTIGATTATVSAILTLREDW